MREFYVFPKIKLHNEKHKFEYSCNTSENMVVLLFLSILKNLLYTHFTSEIKVTLNY